MPLRRSGLTERLSIFCSRRGPSVPTKAALGGGLPKGAAASPIDGASFMLRNGRPGLGDSTAALRCGALAQPLLLSPAQRGALWVFRSSCASRASRRWRRKGMSSWRPSTSASSRCIRRSSRSSARPTWRRSRRSCWARSCWPLENLQRPEILFPALKELGRRHAGYGTKPEHYSAVGAALLDTFAIYLGGAWTPEVKQAWVEAYGAISSLMLEGASRPAS